MPRPIHDLSAHARAIRKPNQDPGPCRACHGASWCCDYPDERCQSCRGTGYQSERQIIINKGVNAAILGAMP